MYRRGVLYVIYTVQQHDLEEALPLLLAPTLNGVSSLAVATIKAHLVLPVAVG